MTPDSAVTIDVVVSNSNMLFIFLRLKINSSYTGVAPPTKLVLPPYGTTLILF